MPNTVILGTGIIGVSTAYYLSLSNDPSTIHLVDPSPILFSSASGYAGGFLSRDWFAEESSDLGSLSFEEHKKLAEEHAGGEKWGYSVSKSMGYVSHVAAENLRKTGKRGVRGDDWLRGGGSRAETASGNDGVSVDEIIGATGLEGPKWLKRNEGDELEVISEDGSTAQVGWCLVARAGHSLVVRTPSWNNQLEEKECHAVFASDEDGYSPEVFSRKGGEIYVAGLNSSIIPLPGLATESKIQEHVVQRLEKTAKTMFGLDENIEMEVVRKGLCFRPVTNRGTPILARIADSDLGGIETRSAGDGGVWLAAGHGPWGISMSLGTGKVMAEMIQGKATSADVSRLGF
ncbi:hypothetical protein SS1G_03310 [Sclerotinia sclerotiorum 1980 UF-70]|uniref:FAD dependent oxidoreductase domain-containing protein n=1 Tax=Sclerotinia sclerotiorum (strain ATCC 18683 / 1980 / Ss-1) TaxID=665079 RepID=A7EDC0_SCLS1|nr:hypothetical protein SS1G_03310 [Sclerotinia sclerotiorum 1980 UF-70]EDO00836.1 hypothetical protein SS1G_03310 [Sclerotinia sclerotiorum 1980 UF-70]